MLHSWENFMSPTGGTLDNSLHFGVPSLFAEFGAGLVFKHVFEPLRGMELRESEVRLNRRGRLIGTPKKHNARTDRGTGDVRERLVPGRRSFPRPGHTHAAAWKGPRSGRPAHLNPGRLPGRLQGINSKYNKLKFGVKAIGWGYVVLGAASIVEAATTPGLTRSAEMNNAQTMGMAPPLDSSQAYTQRQRALMAIHDSQLGIRNVIGSEAGYLHR